MILSTATNVHDSNRLDCIRKFLNGAVYIESCVNNKDIQPNNSATKNATRKRISCSCSAVQLCKTHENQLICKKSGDSLYSSSSDMSVYAENESKHGASTSTNLLKESRTSILSLNNSNSTIDTGTDSHFQSWITRKLEEKRKLLESRATLQEKREKDKQLRLEQERENFKRWLANKKKEQEEKEEKQKQKKSQQENVQEQKKKFRSKEAELKYKLWCKRKEEQELEKKLKEKIDEIKTSEEKQRRMEENRQAYKNWLKLSVNKPTPIPLGKGLESLRASLSVTYVNPIPWQPNIDVDRITSS